MVKFLFFNKNLANRYFNGESGRDVFLVMMIKAKANTAKTNSGDGENS